MATETATYVGNLNSTLPGGSDPRSEGDDHLRLIKAVMKASFPNLNYVFLGSGVYSSPQTLGTSHYFRTMMIDGTVNIPQANTIAPFMCVVYGMTTAVTLVPFGAEKINGVAANLVVPTLQPALVIVTAVVGHETIVIRQGT